MKMDTFGAWIISLPCGKSYSEHLLVCVRVHVRAHIQPTTYVSQLLDLNI